MTAPSPLPQTFYLVGARASGKTTLGARLAALLGLPFFDSDAELCRACGMSVAEVVAREGWPGFRRREKDTLAALAARPGNKVVATGGGMVLDPANREIMRRTGTVLYLAAPAAELARRLAADPNHAQRPSLTGAALAEEVAAVLARRDPLYRETAHLVLDASRDPELLAQELVAAPG